MLSATTTLVFTLIVNAINLTPQSDKDAQRVNAMTLNSMMLTAGWVWKNTILAWERYFREDALDLKYPAFVNYMFVLCGVWVACTIAYHWLLTLGWVKERNRTDVRESISAGFNFQHHDELHTRLKNLEGMGRERQSPTDGSLEQTVQPLQLGSISSEELASI